MGLLQFSGLVGMSSGEEGRSSVRVSWIGTQCVVVEEMTGRLSL